MELVNVGYVVGFHGLKGEMKIKTTTDFAEDRFKVKSKLLLVKDDDIEEVVVKSSRFHKNQYLVSFEGYSTLNDVEKYKGYALAIKKEMLYELDEDEFYYFELLGIDVYDYQENYLGKIVKVMETGANEVLVIKENNREILVPFINSFIKEMDIEKKKIILEDVEGLF